MNIVLKKMRSIQSRLKWTKDQDARLLSTISCHMLNQKLTSTWVVIARRGFGYEPRKNGANLSFGHEHLVRTAKQCRERWTTHLDPSLTHTRWSIEEDRQVLRLFDQLQNKWSHIARSLPGRSSNSVKNRVRVLLRLNSAKRQTAPSNVLPRFQSASETRSVSMTIEDEFMNLLDIDPLDLADIPTIVCDQTSQVNNRMVSVSSFKFTFPTHGIYNPLARDAFESILKAFKSIKNPRPPSIK